MEIVTVFGIESVYSMPGTIPGGTVPKELVQSQVIFNLNCLFCLLTVYIFMINN